MKISPKHLNEGPSAFFNIILTDNGTVDRWEEAPAHINKSILKNFPKLTDHGIGLGNVRATDIDKADYFRYDLVGNGISGKVVDIIKWLNENIGRYKYITVPGLGTIWFRTESDRTLFLLRWK